MRKILIALAFALFSGQGMTAGGGGDVMSADADVTDTASLQNGAKLFVNYCMGCHSMKYMRYSRLADDLEIPESVVEEQLIFSPTKKIGDTMTNAMPMGMSEKWFGAAPPDLSLTARVRGADWVYTYLNTFYRDEERGLGVNNLTLANASMPHVLARLQGVPEPVLEEVHSGGQSKLAVVSVDTPEGSGTLTEDEYHELTRDITNFMVYAAEPVQAERERLGVYVLLFLIVLTFILYLLKREYWKDVH